MKLTVATQSGHNITATVKSELMQNQVTAKVVDTSHKIEVIEDNNGQPIVFSIGSDNHLYVIYNKPNTATGWEQVNLTEEFGSGFTATAFAVSQKKTGIFNLAVAMSNTTATGSQVYVSSNIPNTPSSVKWGSLKADGNWVFRPATDKNVVVSKMLMGANTDLGPKIIAQGEQKDGRGFFKRYFINGNSHSTTWAWKEFPIPENATEILDTTLGIYSKGRLVVQVVYELYKVGNDIELVASGEYKVPHVNQPGQLNIFMKAPVGATSLASTLISDTQTDLYVGGQGVTYFSASTQSNQATGTPIFTADQIPSVHDLIVSQDATNVSLWALSGDENLLFSTQEIGDDWSQPLPIQQSVVQITAHRSSKLNANQIFMVKGDSTLSYMWQDPSTSIWKNNPIPLRDLGEMLSFNSYTSHINLVDETGAAFQDTLHITASAWTYVTINGISHSLDENTPAIVKTDVLGNITIINRVDTMATPIFSIEADDLKKIIDVDPASSIIEGLSKIQTGNDLKNAKTQTGEPVIAAGSKIDTETGAQVIQKLVALHPQSAVSARSVRSSNVRGQMRLRTGRHSSNKLNFAHLDEDYDWSMSISKTAGITLHDGELPQARGIFQTIEGAIGDVVQAIEHVVEDVIHIVVNVTKEIANFVITIGEKIYKFIVKTVEQLYEAMSWLIKQIGIAFDKLIDWLGFIFDWDDILTTHKVFANVAKCSLDYGSYVLDTEVHNIVKTFFDGIKGEIDKLSTLSVASNKKQIRSTSQSKNSQSSFKDTMNSPGGNWGTYQIMHGGVLEGITNSNKTSDPFTAFVDDVIKPTIESVVTTANQLIEDFKLLFDSDGLTTEQVIAKMGIDLLKGIVDAIETIILGLIDLLADLIQFFKTVITEDIEIPLLTTFYKWITKGEDFTVLNAISLVFSIPATIIFKIVANKAPFADGTHDLDTMGFKQMFSLFGVKTSTVKAREALVSRAAETTEPNEAVALYSQIGGYVYGVASFVGGILSAVGAYYSGKEGADGKVSVIGKIKVGVSVVGLAGSFPVGNRSSIDLERAVWGINGAGIIKDAIALKVGEPGKPVVGGYEIVESIAKLVLQIIISAKQIDEDEDPERSYDIMKLFEGILSNLSSGLGGAAKIDKEPESQAALDIASVGVKIISTFLTIARLGASYLPKAVAKVF